MSQQVINTHDKLNRTGDKIPLVGFGTARIKPEDAEEVVYNAIKTGYRLIDGALHYKNEAEVGKAVRRAINDGIVKREDLFIVGKLWNNFHGKEHVKRVFDITFENYGLDYIDLYLVHFPFATAYVDPSGPIGFLDADKKLKLENSPMKDCWHELEKLVDSGRVRNIGISNFNVQSIVDLLTYARIRPSVLEIEHHPYLQQRRLINWAKKQDLHIIAYASFGNSVFDNVPKYLEHLPKLLEHPVIKKVAEKHQRNPGQIALTWATQRGITVIPKSAQVERMKTNLDVLSYKLDDEDFEAINDLEANGRFNDFFENTYGFEFPLFE
ncbi:4-dihydromethyltrisporate dehydrogenase [Gilbertella persicaria]|uniref:4-dihydromethyltrisporate dehydrogenase n=1 Tax=Gilbertella persicaria TaxID=101096 RepID=UPI0022206A4F|nr:4-dihydromethyltrisporate dehydrogenase [Gilbertella persicaria]KAI8064322.1 4-dihydromethyltrisporate dehydrogenase [Gilbertella persicaria]